MEMEMRGGNGRREGGEKEDDDGEGDFVKVGMKSLTVIQ